MSNVIKVTIEQLHDLYEGWDVNTYDTNYPVVGVTGHREHVRRQFKGGKIRLSMEDKQRERDGVLEEIKMNRYGDIGSTPYRLSIIPGDVLSIYKEEDGKYQGVTVLVV